ALMLARGATSYELALDFLARTGSSSEGRNLPGHFSSRRINAFSIASPVASQCLPACGAAWGIQKEGSAQMVLCTIGDAATRQGEFYEAVCLAVQEKLPIVFVIEDNGYGISTSTKSQLPFRLHIFDSQLVCNLNGRDAFEVFARGSEAIQKARQGGGPSLLWCELDRLGSHTSADDQRVYRCQQELEAIVQNDPIPLLANRLIKMAELSQSEWEAMQQEVTQEIDRIYQQAEQAPFPDPNEVQKHLFAPPVKPAALPLAVEASTETMVSSINRVLALGLETFPKMMLFGEDIEDPKGGVFGFTKGLSTRFGKERVKNSPLAEATILGTAVGLAATGYKPVFELQFIDFLPPGFNQLVSQMATLRWRSKGEWGCPVVLYAPYGAYLPAGGMWHSQSNEGYFCHTPGLRVAVPSTPEDAVGLFWSAFMDNDPSLILIPKHLFRIRMPVKEYKPLEWGQAKVRKEGKDVSLVSWGNGMELGEQAAEALGKEGVSVELVDLRSLCPCDYESVQKSLEKTGRLVVVQESQRTCSMAEALIAEMVSLCERFYLLQAPPQLVSRADVPIPFCPSLEYALLPDLEQVLNAIRNTLE
ncbi:MAG TPA: thiamine pyrophosphate-dependent enzyme, partial [Chthonomonadaceae bacterium]|nr:thiamine pyrophosphate-dependent enzyme [Chthonomonadaceae bacterium]